MKTRFSLILSALAIMAGIHQAAPQGTAFTYQGSLQVAGVPANGLYDIRASGWSAESGGSMLSAYDTNSAVAVSNGLFTILIDFGAGVFTGQTAWLQIDVRTNGAVVDFTALSPREELTPTPYAIFAEGANAGGLSGTIPSAGLSGTYGSIMNFTNPGNSFTGNGAGLSGVNAATLNGLASASFWNTSGNAGTTPAANFVGTIDNQPLQLRSFNTAGFQLQYASYGNILTGITYGMNILGGYWGNIISNGVVGGTIAGGGDAFRAGIIFGSSPNVVSADFGAVGGGLGNTAGYLSVVPGGQGNMASGYGSFAAGQYAQGINNGTFLWSDGSQNPFSGPGVDNAFSALASGGVFFYNGANGVHIDGMGNNNGTIDYALKFGGALSSGEGIASKRTAGGNQYGLDFYTASVNCMSLESGGAMRVNDNNILLRTSANSNHDGLGYRDTFAGLTFDGPLLWGYLGGALGTVVPDEVSLTWDYQGNVWVSNNCSVATLTIRGGADVAEPFEITAKGQEVTPGAVVIIDETNPGQLKLSDQPYDSHVAGVVSGANGIHPGIQMQQQGLLEGGKNVALTGRVYVQADASNGPIKPGDLLTTSGIPGRAMRVTDHAKAQGAILGKAMTGLSNGQGMVLVLVTLQ